MNTQWNHSRPSNTTAKLGNKFVSPSNGLLTLVPKVATSNKMARTLRCYCKSTFEFISETKMEETNKKYLCRILSRDMSDKLLLSYPVRANSSKYIEKLANLTLDLEHYDYFVDCDLADQD